VDDGQSEGRLIGSCIGNKSTGRLHPFVGSVRKPL
jgi:hypothetical protein